jgi:PIN domain nuclease of toxin-antitoxin system
MSVGSLWEIIVKAQARQLRLPRPVGEYLTEKLSDNGVFVLPLTFGHVMRIASLPRYHGDPFDRILIAQSLEEDLPLVTADKVFARYPVKVIWN